MQMKHLPGFSGLPSRFLSGQAGIVAPTSILEVAPRSWARWVCLSWLRGFQGLVSKQDTRTQQNSLASFVLSIYSYILSFLPVIWLAFLSVGQIISNWLSPVSIYKSILTTCLSSGLSWNLFGSWLEMFGRLGTGYKHHRLSKWMDIFRSQDTGLISRPS